MIRFFENIAFDVERNLKNPVIAFRAYCVIFVFSLIVFGFYGILPLGRTLKTKLAVLNQLQTAHATMKINLENLQHAEIAIKENAQGIAYLDEYMPQDTNVQTYMLDFMKSVGSGEFTLKDFSQDLNSAVPGQIGLSLTMEGFTYPTKLLKNIEVLKRVTQIRQLNVYRSDDGLLTANILLTIYTILN